MDYGKALERLKRNGYKYTGKRESIVRLFAMQDRYLSAKEVQSCLSKDYPGLSLERFIGICPCSRNWASWKGRNGKGNAATGFVATRTGTTTI